MPNTRGSNTQKQIPERLKVVLASSYALCVKTQNFHWNVKGPNFFSLHELFEEQYRGLFEAVDTVAERIRALGEPAPGSFEAFSHMSVIKEASEAPADAKAMVSTLAVDNTTLSKLCAEVGIASDEAEDPATADIMNGRIRAHDKAAWMLRSHA